MATMVACTSLNLTNEQKKALCAGVEKATAEAFHIPQSICGLMIMPRLDENSHGPSVDESITYFVYTAPGKPDDYKRAICKGIDEATKAVVGPMGKGKVVIIIKEHENINVAVDGVLKADM